MNSENFVYIFRLTVNIKNSAYLTLKMVGYSLSLFLKTHAHGI